MYVDNTARTPFDKYSHPQLWDMLQAGEEKSARKAADDWDAVGGRLHEQASNLEAKLAQFKQHWRGGAAEQYQVMVGDLSTGLRKIGDVAFRMRDLTHDAADALVTAKKEMPPPVPVPDLSATTLRMATTPLEVSPFMAPTKAMDMQQQQQDAVYALQQHQQAAAASDAAHAKAVAVMNELAGHYQVADQQIPRTPAGGTAPGVPGAQSTDPGQLPLVPLPPDQLNQPSGKPVFGNMFTAGLGAAAAASVGRLGIPLLPKVPPWASDKKKDEKAPPAPKSGMGGGGLKGIGGGGSVGGGSPPPTPQAGVVGGAGAVGGAAAALRGVAGVAGAASGMGGGMPMMPMMPMTPGAGDMAGARRIPPWLMETEEVWGQSSTITPSVVGEDPPEPNPPSEYRF